MEKAMRVFLACALGAFIGSIVALQFNHYFWWLGLLVGGFAGYISYEFKKVLAAAPAAWEMASKAGKTKIHFCGPIKKAGKISAFVFVLLAITFFTGIITTILGLCFLVNVNVLITLGSPGVNFLTETLQLFRVENLSAIIAISFCFVLFAFTVVLFVVDEQYEGIGKSSKSAALTAAVVVVALTGAPILTILSLTPYAGYKLTPRAIKFFGKFVKFLFILIHSDIRLLCATDAAIGTAIGYFSGSALVGAIAGGIFGVINYLIVSVKLFKLNHT